MVNLNLADDIDIEALTAESVARTLLDKLALNDIRSCLQLAELLVEHAGYVSAGERSREDTVELMLLSARIAQVKIRLGGKD